MPVIFGVALGGAFGASARYLLDRFIEQHSESVFPWSTFAINVTGCLVIGVVIEQLVDRHHLPCVDSRRDRRRRARRLHDVLDVLAGDLLAARVERPRDRARIRRRERRLWTARRLRGDAARPRVLGLVQLDQIPRRVVDDRPAARPTVDDLRLASQIGERLGRDRRRAERRGCRRRNASQPTCRARSATARGRRVRG